MIPKQQHKMKRSSKKNLKSHKLYDLILLLVVGIIGKNSVLRTRLLNDIQNHDKTHIQYDWPSQITQ